MCPASPHPFPLLFPDVARLDRVERRYLWVKRQLKVNEDVWRIFPDTWQVTKLLCAQFCRITRWDPVVLTVVGPAALGSMGAAGGHQLLKAGYFCPWCPFHVPTCLLLLRISNSTPAPPSACMLLWHGILLRAQLMEQLDGTKEKPDVATLLQVRGDSDGSSGPALCDHGQAATLVRSVVQVLWLNRCCCCCCCCTCPRFSQALERTLEFENELATKFGEDKEKEEGQTGAAEAAGQSTTATGSMEGSPNVSSDVSGRDCTAPLIRLQLVGISTLLL